jgi:hypothetical protein
MARLSLRRQQINADKAEIRRIKRIARLRLCLNMQNSVWDRWQFATIHRLQNKVYPRYVQDRSPYRKKGRKRETIVNRLLHTKLVTEEEFLEMFRVTKKTFLRLHQFLYKRIEVPTSSRPICTKVQLMAFPSSICGLGPSSICGLVP